MNEYFAMIKISSHVAEKINSKHKISPIDIRTSLIYSADFRAFWEYNIQHGDRLVVIGNAIGNRRFVAYFLPVDADEGIWTLKSARWLD